MPERRVFFLEGGSEEAGVPGAASSSALGTLRGGVEGACSLRGSHASLCSTLNIFSIFERSSSKRLSRAVKRAAQDGEQEREALLEEQRELLLEEGRVEAEELEGEEDREKERKRCLLSNKQKPAP